jgi:hypothetical protein
VNSLLRWEETRAPTHAGLAGEVWLFTYTWDDAAHPLAAPWALTTTLPGLGGKEWHGATEDVVRKIADGLLADWLKRIGVPS